MIPTLSLGPWDSPKLELMPSDINPILALLIEQYSPMGEGDRDSLLFFLQMDTAFLHDDTEGFFLKLDSICKRVVTGELTQFNIARIQMSEFADYLRIGENEGVVTSRVKAAAQRFLDFLSEHPDYWPLQSSKA